MYYLCILICFANYPVWSVLFQVTTVEWSHLMMPRPAPSSSWIHNTSHIFSVIYLFQIFCLFVNSVVVVLSCTHDIYCMMMAHPGRGTPPLWLFLRLLPFFSPRQRFFFLTQIEGLRTEDVVVPFCTLPIGDVVPYFVTHHHHLPHRPAPS